MSRWIRLVVPALVLLAAAPAARASGPMPLAVQGGPGVVSPDGKLRYTAVPAGLDTVLTVVSTADGTLRHAVTQDGAVGIPRVDYGRAGSDGISADGRTLVLQSAAFGAPTSFRIVDLRRLDVRDAFTLRGAFAYDALSPTGRTLYLIQYAAQDDLTHYVVRAYDTVRNRLLPGRIADRTQKTWVMQGFPVTRTTSPGGRWVYTLYSNPGGYPFVHALDTVAGVAHCVGLPWHGSEADLYKLVLSLRDGGRTLSVSPPGGRPWVDVARGSWRISYPGAAGFPWRWVGPGIAGGLALLSAAALLLRRRLRRDDRRHAGRELGLA
jgi:hypothetical protein